MGVDETLSQIKRLLEMMQGVEVVWTRTSPQLIRIGLAVRYLPSLACLAHFKGAANVLMVVEVDWHWQGEADDPECLRYDMRIPSESEPFELPSSLQVLGIYLARYLKEHGVLESHESDQLQRAWNAEVE